MTKTITALSSLFKKMPIILVLFFLFGCGSSEDVFQGYVEGSYAYIASAISGNLTQRLVDRGDQVTSNQPLFILDPEPETAKLNQAKFQLLGSIEGLLNLQKGARQTAIENIEAQLKQAQAGLFFAEKSFVRSKILYKSKSIDESSFDEAKKNHDQNLQKVKEVSAVLDEAKLGARKNVIAAQKAIVAAAKAATEQARWALLQKSVRSPVNAQVFDTLYEPGEFVGAGMPVVVLLPPEKIKIIFFVSERIISRVKVGNEIVVDCDSCKNSYKAKIVYISPNAEFTPPVIFSQDSRGKLVYRVEAKFGLKGSRNFHPGQPVDVVIEKNIAK